MLKEKEIPLDIVAVLKEWFPGGTNFELIEKIVSPDGKHTAYVIGLWNGYVRIMALILDNRCIDYRVSISKVRFSSDLTLEYEVFTVEDPVFEDWPDAHPPREYHAFYDLRTRKRIPSGY